MFILNGSRSPLRRPRSALLALGLLSAFGPISLDLYLPALPRVSADLHASSSLGQLTLSGALAGLAVGQLLVGPVSDRFGRRRPLLAGLVGFALFSLACAVAPTMPVLIVFRVLQGVCGAAGVVLARAVVRDAFDDSAIAGVFSVLMLINGVAPVAAPLVGGGLLHLIPWRGLFLVLVAIGVAIGLLAAISLPETLPPSARHTGGLRALRASVGEVCADRGFVLATVVLTLGSGALFVYISLSSFVLQTQYHLSASAFSAVFAVNSVGIVVGGRLGALVLRTRTSRSVLGLGVLLLATGSTLAAAAAVADAPIGVLLPPVFLAVASLGLVLPNATAIALLGHARNAGTASAILGAIQYLAGAAAGPLVSTVGTTASTMTIGMTLAALSAVVAYAALRAGDVRAPAAEFERGYAVSVG